MKLPNDNIFIQIRQKAELDIFRMKVILHRKRVRTLKTVERRKVIKTIFAGCLFLTKYI